MGPLDHKPPAKIFLPGVSERLVSGGAADLELCLFWDCNGDSYRPLAHVDNTVYPLGRQQPFKTSKAEY